ncbi:MULTISPECIES: Ig-like domain-containing protein [Corallococcus]|uniref:RCC1 domain-containing protein n=1 Tax=Corallococcus TaxID=83461 RepID=UPI001F2E08A7|nr:MULTISPECIES: PKD domain-containing protein [Corallococcus]
MRRASRSGLAVLALGLVLALAGCGSAQQDVAEGSAQAVVTMSQALSASDVARMELTVSGAGMTTRTDALVKTGGQWGGVLGQLPAGSGRTFSAQAFDASNTVRYSGQVANVTVQAGQTTAVTLLLQEVNAPPSFENAAPRILSLVASPGTVAPGGQVALQATADDPNVGDTLTYTWTAASGSFSAASSLTSTWTAPATPGPVVLTLTVTDSKGASTSLSVTVTVSTGAGSAAVNIAVNTWPQVATVTALPSSIAVGQASTVTAAASDNDGDSLGYQWTASCVGTWTNATSASASFTPSAQPSGGTCTLTVVASDGRGGQGQGSLGIYVGPGTSGRFPPEVVETSQSSASVPASGGTITFRVKAQDVQGSALGFTWATSTGTLGTATNTASSSEVLWTAPSCVPSGTTASVTATVTNALGLSTSFAFALQGGAACAASSGARLATGDIHSLGLKQDGTVWAWGTSSFGQLGDGTTDTRRLTPVQVQGLAGVAALAAGGLHSLGLKQDGTVWAWGYNVNGQLGDGTTTHRLTPVQVQGLTGVVALDAGYVHTLALKQDGTVWAWGSNSNGQLGDGTTTDRLLPVQVQGLTGVVALAASSAHTLALKQDGTVWAWGSNYYGQLGNGTTTDRLLPVQVSGLTGVTALASGGYHILALKQDGTVWAWGYNSRGQLGDGTTTQHRLTPMQVPGLTGVAALAAGHYHTVALKQDGTVWAWGDNGFGQLGDGTATDRFTPMQVSGLTGVTALTAGITHTLALKQGGTVWVTGRNREGQLGDGTTKEGLAPRHVSGLSL